MDIRSTIRDFLKVNFIFSDERVTLDDAVSFLESGLVDSTGMVEIVEFVEETFGITIEDDELVPENLDSINNLTRFLDKKLEENAKKQSFSA